MNLSTGAVYAILEYGAIKALKGREFALYFYSGAIPDSADDAPSGTLLMKCDRSIATTNTLDKALMQVSLVGNWQGRAIASGTVGWYRLRHEDDDSDVLSTVDIRIDGTVSTAAGDLLLSALPLIINDDTIEVVELYLAADSVFMGANGSGEFL